MGKQTAQAKNVYSHHFFQTWETFAQPELAHACYVFRSEF